MADNLEDILIKHQIYLQRLVPHYGNESIAVIDSMNRDLRVDLTEWLDNNEQFKLTIQQQ